MTTNRSKAMKQLGLGLNMSTKNADGQLHPEMKQTRKGNQWYLGMKVHIGVDAHSGCCTPWRAQAS